MLYHASPVGGLKTLLPHRSTHEEEYVYALRDELSSCVRLFGLTPAQMRADPRFSLYYPWLMNA